MVIDTNVLFSALYRPASPPGRIIIMGIEGRLVLCAPDQVRDELVRNLREKLDYDDDEVGEALASLPVEWFDARLIKGHLRAAQGAVSHDADAALVALALLLDTGVVSGDKGFHPLRTPVVPAWRPAELVRLLS